MRALRPSTFVVRWYSSSSGGVAPASPATAATGDGSASAMGPQSGVPLKSVPELYRDLMRLCQYVGGSSAKGDALRGSVRAEFRKNAGETDEDAIEAQKFAAIRAMSNYLLLSSSSSDDKLKAAMRKSAESVAEQERKAHE